MKFNEALNILRALSDGLNPYTGETLAPESIYQNPQTVRALCCVLRALGRTEKRERRRQVLLVNAGKSWSPDETKRVCAEYRSGLSVRTIAKMHSRSTGAIASRLAKLGVMPIDRNGESFV